MMRRDAQLEVGESPFLLIFCFPCLFLKKKAHYPPYQEIVYWSSFMLALLFLNINFHRLCQKISQVNHLSQACLLIPSLQIFTLQNLLSIIFLNFPLFRLIISISITFQNHSPSIPSSPSPKTTE